MNSIAKENFVTPMLIFINSFSRGARGESQNISSYWDGAIALRCANSPSVACLKKRKELPRSFLPELTYKRRAGCRSERDAHAAFKCEGRACSARLLPLELMLINSSCFLSLVSLLWLRNASGEFTVSSRAIEEKIERK
jgi:hypothetical protein